MNNKKWTITATTGTNINHVQSNTLHLHYN